jgi:hypothetical protein
MQWPRLLAYITGRVDRELLVRNEYLAAENRILRAKLKGQLQLSEGRSVAWPKSPAGTQSMGRSGGGKPRYHSALVS